MKEIQRGCILALGIIMSALICAGQPAKELMQYLRDARKAGLPEAQIAKNAIEAGWPKETVSEAIAFREKAAPEKLAPEKVAEKLPEKSAEPAKAPQPPAEPSPAEVASKDVGTPQPRSKPVNRGVADDYQIGEGDVLQISVWKEPDASVPNAVVRPDGRISMPMLKEVHVSGLTPTQVETAITEQLTKFISAPDVTVIVSGIHSKKIYVIGGVKKEGPIAYTYRMTILQAISEAGGLTDYAKKKQIYVLRHENGRDYRLPFDYDAALRGARMELNIPLLPGDTLVVPK